MAVIREGVMHRMAVGWLMENVDRRRGRARLTWPRGDDPTAQGYEEGGQEVEEGRQDREVRSDAEAPAEAESTEE